MSYSRFSNLGQKRNSDLTGKIMDGIHDKNLQWRKCSCNKLSKLEDRKCMYDGECEITMVVYELKFLMTGKSYIGKTQRTLKTRTKERINGIWNVISSGRNKFGKKWFGSGGYAGADAFSKHFGNLCRSYSSGNQMR